MDEHTLGLWTRTCQECDHQQVDNPPKSTGPTDAYLNRKCRRCKSEALDYGSYKSTQPDEDWGEES